MMHEYSVIFIWFVLWIGGFFVLLLRSASLVNNAEPIFPAVQAQATYPQPQPAYAQPAYAQPAYPYPQAQNNSITYCSAYGFYL